MTSAIRRRRRSKPCGWASMRWCGSGRTTSWRRALLDPRVSRAAAGGRSPTRSSASTIPRAAPVLHRALLTRRRTVDARVCRARARRPEGHACRRAAAAADRGRRRAAARRPHPGGASTGGDRRSRAARRRCCKLVTARDDRSERCSWKRWSRSATAAQPRARRLLLDLASASWPSVARGGARSRSRGSTRTRSSARSRGSTTIRTGRCGPRWRRRSASCGAERATARADGDAAATPTSA